MRRWFFGAALAAGLALPGSAHAFCGFYVSGADASLYNNATVVVLMRDGTRTVLSMANNYDGPPADFAMVVPVPVVLQEKDVKTLPHGIFDRVDLLAAPRLVEYWEQDPCNVRVNMDILLSMAYAEDDAGAYENAEGEDLGVTIEAQFEVGEYQIVVLSAKDSTGLDTWLRINHYKIPPGAEPVLRPYVQSGMKFFVAKVDVERVTFNDGVAALSPLRVHYDSPAFSLPVRLGLLNSEGEQDLLVHILAKGQRYEVANYDNAFIPTNIRVSNGARDGFGDFYDALFRQTVRDKAKTVVTEYSWDASSCDPCPTPALDGNELTTLGADVLGGDTWGWVLTRLHYRYTADALGEDLVFQAAPPMVGGRGTPNLQGELTEQQPQSSSINNFQGRYVILHPWEGRITCDNPTPGYWGGPPDGSESKTASATSTLSGGERGGSVKLASIVEQDIPWIGLTRAADAAAPPSPGPSTAAPSTAAPLTPEQAEDDVELEDSKCGAAPRAGGVAALALALVALLRRRREV
ncbi:MAG: DUF2330 domain-containing protein [Alphaproteobacteria bacterium]|nr:DUF2330 domain-containing protein [Alphaproteobacteria bacterium]